MRRPLAIFLTALVALGGTVTAPRAQEAQYYRHNGGRAPAYTGLSYPQANVTARASESTTVVPAYRLKQGPGTFSAPNGLPSGLSLNAFTGVLTAYSTAPGTYQPVTVALTDGLGKTVTATSPAITVLPQLRVAYPGTLTGVVGARLDAGPLVWDGVGGTPRVQIIDGTLPDGVTLDPNSGHLGGVPTVAGNRNVTFSIYDASDGRQVSAGQTTFVITQPGPLAISQANPPDAMLNTTYGGYTVPVSGGRGQMTFTLTSGAVPTGMAFSSTGTLTGRPGVVGSFPIGFHVTDFDGRQADGGITLQVVRSLVVNPPTLSRGTESVTYPASVYSVSNADGATSWVATGLPSGMALSSDGILSGTPALAGTTPFTVSVTDSRNNTASLAQTLNVDDGLVATAPSLPMGATNSVYPAQTFTSTGGGGTKTWTATGLPSGLSMTSAGRLQGTPKAAGSFTVHATVKDASNRTASVDAPLQVTAVFAVSAASLPKGSTSASFGPVTLTSAGGNAPIGWTVQSGALPAGVTLSNAGVISGTPTETGSFSLVARATDGTASTADISLSTTVADPVTLTGPSSLPRGTVGVSYAMTGAFIAAGGRTTPTVTASGLPSGLVLSSGMVMGTPTAPASGQITVRATDADGRQATPLQPVLAVDAALSVATTVLPADVASTAMAPFGLQAAGGRGPFVWTVDPSTLHVGVTMNDSGVLQGTPTSTGTRVFPVTVRDVDGRQATGSVSHTVDADQTHPALSGAPPASIPISTTQNLSPFTVTGGQGPYAFAVSTGWMPPGLTMTSDGRITGSSGYSGTWSFTVRVTDSLGRSGEGGPFAMQVTGPYTITGSLPGHAKVGQPYYAAFYVTAAPPNGTFFTYRRTGTNSWGSQSQIVVPGVTLNPSTGEVSGAPTIAGTYSGIEIWHNVGSWTGVGPFTVVVDP